MAASIPRKLSMRVRRGENFVHGDFARIAEDTRSVISAALFGALAATGALPFRREQFEDAIRKGASAWKAAWLRSRPVFAQRKSRAAKRRSGRTEPAKG